MTFIEFNEYRDNQVQDEEYYQYELQPEEQLSQDVYEILNRYQEERRRATIRTDIDMINNDRESFYSNLQNSINALFTIMSALNMAILFSHNREYLLVELEKRIVECESYYSNHIPLFSNIISMAKELSNSERQNGWIDRDD